MTNKIRNILHRLSPYKIISLLLILVYFIILTIQAVRLPIWQDEAYTIYTVRLSCLDSWSRGINFEEQSPLYYFILSIWEKILPSIIGLRLFSVVFSVGSCLILLNFVDRDMKSYQKQLSLFILALPHLFWAGLEIRLYSLSIFILILMFCLLEKWETVSIRKFILLVLLGTTNLYINFLSAIPVCILLLYYFLYRRQKAYVFIMLFSVLLFLPILLQLYNIYGTSGNEHSVSFIDSLKYSILTTLRFLSDAKGILMLRTIKWACIVIILIYTVIKKELSILFLFFGIVVFSVLEFITGNLGVFSSRHFLCLLPLLFLVILRFNFRFSPFVLAPLVIMNFFSVFPLVVSDSKDGSWNHVAAIAEEYITDKVLIFASENIYPFEIYYDKSVEILTIPNQIDRDKFDIKSMSIISEEQLDIRFDHIIEENEKFLFIGALNWKEYRGINFNTEILSEYIIKRFNILDHQIVDGTYIYYLQN